MSQHNIDVLIDSFTVYLEVNRNYSKGTVEIYNHAILRLSSWLKETKNITYIDEISANDIQMYLGTLRHPKIVKDTNKKHPQAGTIYAATTRARIISAIKQFFKWAVKQHYLQYDVSQYIENPKLGDRLPKSLTLQDAMKFEEFTAKRNFSERDSLITTLFLLLGLRVSELVSINLENFNEDDGSLTIIGKGNKERKLVLTPKILRALEIYKPARQAILEKRNRVEEAALFISQKQGKRLTRRAVGLIIESIASEAGVKANNQKVTPHKLRHTCATVLYNDGEGADLLAIADLLGHADPKTATIYTKVNIEKMRKIVTSNPLELT
ncbi:tyrosine-type recombinase/integrase [Paenibacillus sp. ISL-20]|uniref:tyrosine-type recombinase/integrase n=1 Tax=Paenibacillus sp. ISL-20 TaxID=2819163 RepID=UPI001BE58DA2|nr:tyrosine-type recombinase/integrase [Paenibacillus sp. ISL-20]MBT2764424.1 tyrosine-type recombinase/integrase [Paenibacillus sp. ISL-20]